MIIDYKLKKIWLWMFVCCLFYSGVSFAAELHSEGFESETVGQNYAGSVFDTGYSRNAYMTIVDTPTRTGSRAIRSEYTPAYGSLKYDLPHPSAEGDEYYFQWYLYFPAGWDWDAISDTNFKQPYSYGGGGISGDPVYTIRRGAINGCTANQNRLSYVFQDASPPFGGQGACFDSLANGTWHKFEYYIKYSTTTGEIWAKINDVEVMSDSGLNTLEHLASGPITFFSIPTMNGRGQDQVFYMDDFEAHDSIPSAPSDNPGNPGNESSDSGGGCFLKSASPSKLDIGAALDQSVD